MTSHPPFWKTKSLTQMTREEWESLCDGCAKCCVIKLQDDDTDEVFYTNVVCHLLDLETCRCTDYSNRKTKVPTCVVLDAENLSGLSWMPKTCAYRLVAEGKDLPDWHPLVSGLRSSPHDRGASVRGKVISEADVSEDDLPHLLTDWD